MTGAMHQHFRMFMDHDGPDAREGDFRARRGAPLPEGQAIGTREDAIAAMKTVYDPEIPVDIWELGLIYTIDIDPKDGAVVIQMTLTAPGCPVAGEMPGMVADALVAVPGFGEIEVTLTFDPPWTPERMSDEARVALDWF
jgi:FeS assembly SUF system protein